MAPVGKRTRQSAESENPSASPSTSTSTPPALSSMAPPTPVSRPTTRRALQSTPSLSDTSSPSSSNTARGPLTPPETPSPSRPILTRSATMRAPGHSPLGRAATMGTSSRRLNSPLSSAGPSGSFGNMSSVYASSSIGPGTPSGGPATRSGVLTRTQSSPALASPSALKAAMAPGGSGTGKGGPEDVFGLGRRPGRGKENVPPRKEDEENQRKRLRVTSGPRSVTSRGRSGSVASVRSESSSSASSFYSCGPNLLSPSPSPSTPASSRSSVDPFDLITPEDHDDIERTPTKTRPIRDARTLPTPPASSSPFMASASAARTKINLDSARRRMSLVKMSSTSSLETIGSDEMGSGSDTETEVDVPSSPSKFRPRNPYKQLKSLLRLSSTSDKSSSAGIIGRDEEKDALTSYFSLRSDRDVGMYVSGPPGTGKTALVTAMGKEVARQGWKVVEVGCMGLGVNDVWKRLGQGLRCVGTEGEVGLRMAQGGRDTLIILDEIDSLLPAPPAQPTSATSHLLSKLFSFPLLSNAERTVKLIAISNTLDLTVRANLVLPSGSQPAILPFKAYGAADMARIVNARLEQVTAAEDAVKVDPKAVELLTRKVEAQNGDLRMCLATLGMAVNLAEADWVKKGSTTDLALALGPTLQVTPLIKVSLPHVIKAFTSHTQQLKAAAGSGSGGGSTSAAAKSGAADSATSRKIRSVPLQGKMVLVSILIYLSRSRAGLPGVPSNSSSGSSSSSAASPASTPNRHGDLSTSSLYATYSAVMTHESSPFPPAAESDYRDLLSNLETLGLVSVSGGGHGYGFGASSGFGLGFGTPRSGSSGSRSKHGAAAGGAARVELCVRDEEVRAGLGLDNAGLEGASGASAGKGRADEEVAKVWAREEGKVVRQREKLARAVEALKAVAAEDA